MTCACTTNYSCLRCDTLRDWKSEFRSCHLYAYKTFGPGEAEQEWKHEYRCAYLALGMALDIYAN